jgi:signal transduction histidine kinase
MTFGLFVERLPLPTQSAIWLIFFTAVFMVNYDFLAEAAEGNREFMVSLLRLTADEFLKRVNDLEVAVKLNDSNRVRQIRHRFQPHVESYQLTQLETSLQQVAQQMAAGQQPAPDEMAALRRLVENIADELRQKADSIGVES